MAKTVTKAQKDKIQEEYQAIDGTTIRFKEALEELAFNHGLTYDELIEIIDF